MLGLARAGASVVINYASDAGAADELVSHIGHNRAIALQADAGNVREIERMVERTVTKFGKIDIVIANAGMLLMKDLENTSEEDFDAIVALNVKGPYFLVQVRFSPFPPTIPILWISSSPTANTPSTSLKKKN